MLSKKVWLAAVAIGAVGLGVRLTLAPSADPPTRGRRPPKTELESDRHFATGADSFELRRAPEAAQALGLAASNFLDSEEDFAVPKDESVEDLGHRDRELVERHASGEMRGVENAFVFTTPDAAPTVLPPEEKEEK